MSTENQPNEKELWKKLPSTQGADRAETFVELVAEFQWLTAQESMKDSLKPDKLSDIEMEIADVAIYLFRLSDVLGVDLANVMRKKMAINEGRF